MLRKRMVASFAGLSGGLPLVKVDTEFIIPAVPNIGVEASIKHLGVGKIEQHA